MQTVDIYIKLDKCVQTAEEDVYLKDIAAVWCTDEQILAKARSIRIYSFGQEGTHRKCISAMAVVQALAGLSPAVSVQNIGEADVLIEYTAKRKPGKWRQKMKVVLVTLVSFFGTSFTIMAFHNDIGIEKLFSGIYEQVMGEPSNGLTILEFSYSVGLAIGITVFFNHLGRRRLTADSTPIEVGMKMYEDDINTTIIEEEKRKGESLESL